mmetsp:Transcript_33480/g.78270  ORF Transcript_33480/g.78270 Transcript_33480/m.78270 type:complete len:90 (-) Transcript_33480:48-317(-)
MPMLWGQGAPCVKDLGVRRPGGHDRPVSGERGSLTGNKEAVEGGRNGMPSPSKLTPATAAIASLSSCTIRLVLTQAVETNNTYMPMPSF